jgi:hypothetical protein
MGKKLRFDPRRRKQSYWTKPSSYAHRGRRIPKPARFWRERPRRRRNWNVGLGWLTILALAIAWVVWDSRGFLSSTNPPNVEVQEVEATWSYCGIGRGRHCVVDGDTFRIGDTSVRVIGIDTPERDARCEREAMKAEAARAALLAWLNAGPFMMAGKAGEPVDRYGRSLRDVWREAGGERQSLSKAMIDAGLAREYDGGTRGDWCG